MPRPRYSPRSALLLCINQLGAYIYFAGFLPPKTTARKKALQPLSQLPTTLIIYETPNRLLEMLTDILETLGNRPMAVVREITKKFEEVKRGTVQELIDFYTQFGEPKGELVLVIGWAETESEWTAEKIENLILETLKSHTARDTADIVSAKTNLPRKEIYKQVMNVQK